jgi:hypothetical protein
MAMHTRIGLVLAAAAMTAALGCSDSADDQTFDGKYQGDGVDSQDSSNRKEFTLTLTSSGTTVGGTFRIKAILVDSSGNVTGTLDGGSLNLLLSPSNADCPYRIKGTWSPGRIQGTYLATPCFVRSDGTIDLEKK